MESLIYLPKYDWEVKVLYNTSPRHTDYILRCLHEMGCPERNLYRAIDLLESGDPNQGLTYSDKRNRSTLIVVGHASSVAEMLSTISHECSHLVDHISQYYGIPYASEENAYLYGDVAKRLFENAVGRLKIALY